MATQQSSVVPGTTRTKTSASKPDVDFFAKDLNEKYDKLTTEIHVLAKGCFEASQKLTDDDKKTLMIKLKFDRHEFSKFVSIGGKKSFGDPSIRKALPMGYTVLYSLSKIDDPKIEELVRNKQIHPKLTRKQADDLRSKSPTSRKKKQNLPKGYVVGVTLTSTLSQKDRQALEKWAEEGRNSWKALGK